MSLVGLCVLLSGEDGFFGRAETFSDNCHGPENENVFDWCGKELPIVAHLVCFYPNAARAIRKVIPATTRKRIDKAIVPAVVSCHFFGRKITPSTIIRLFMHGS